MPRGGASVGQGERHTIYVRDMDDLARVLNQRPFEDDYTVHANVKSQVDLAAIEGCRRDGIIDEVTVMLLLEDRLFLDRLVDHAEGCCPWEEGVPWRLTATDVELHRVWRVIMQLADMHGSLDSKGGISLRKWAGVNLNLAHLGRDVSLLAMATQFAGPEVVGALLELRANPNACVRVGHHKRIDAPCLLPLSTKSFMENVSPLHLAAKRGSPDILKKLIEVRIAPHLCTLWLLVRVIEYVCGRPGPIPTHVPGTGTTRVRYTRRRCSGRQASRTLRHSMSLSTAAIPWKESAKGPRPRARWARYTPRS